MEQRYLVGEELGAGGFGSVYTGIDTFSNTDVAIKFVAVSRAKEDHRYQRELAALWQARVPGVVELLDDGQSDAFAYLVMERIHGQPFPGTTRTTDQPIDAYEFLRRTASLLRSLRHLHASRIVHGDLKPQNALVQPDGACILVDLGISQEGDVISDRKTNQGTLGTPYYMAPERIYGASSSEASDYYSTGVMLCDSARNLQLEGSLDAEIVAAIEGLSANEPAARTAAFETLRAMLEEMLGYAHPPKLLVTREVGAAHPQDRPLDREQLAGLIDAPSRIFQCPQRIADCLLDLTLGRRHLVAQLFQGWVASGLGTWVEERFRSTPEQITRILALNNERLLDRRLLSSPPLSPEAGRLWTALAAQPVRRIPTCALESSTELPSRIGDHVEELRNCGILVEDARDLILIWTPEHSEQSDRGDSLASAITTILRSPSVLNDPNRETTQNEEQLEALQDTAEAAARDGNVTRAFRMTTRVLTQIRRRASENLQLYDRALATAAEWALTASHKSAVDIARAHAELHPTQTRESQAWAPLLAAAAKVMQGVPESACEIIDEHLGALQTVSQKRLAHIIVNLASMRTKSTSHMERRVRASARWVKANPTKRHRSLLSAWTGWLQFERGRYIRSANLHQRAARHATRRRARCTALMNSASAFLEAGRLEQAKEKASEVLALANGARDSVNTARAERMLRAVAYRQGCHLVVDSELAASARALAPGTIRNLILIGEAAIAWRSNDRALTAELCTDVEGRDTPTGLEVLAACLRQIVMPTQDPGVLWRRVLSLASTAPIGITAQAAALLIASNEGPSGTDLRELTRFSDWAKNEQQPNQRREVLSPAEAASMLSLATVGDAALPRTHNPPRGR